MRSGGGSYGATIAEVVPALLGATAVGAVAPYWGGGGGGIIPGAGGKAGAACVGGTPATG